jgi:hypothetical protein
MYNPLACSPDVAKYYVTHRSTGKIARQSSTYKSKLLGHCFDRHHAVTYDFLPLIKFAGGLAITERKIGSIDIYPAKKRLPFLAWPSTFSSI